MAGFSEEGIVGREDAVLEVDSVHYWAFCCEVRD